MKTDTCLKDRNTAWVELPADKGGDEESKEANNSLETKKRPGGRGSRGKTETWWEGEAEERQRPGRKGKPRKDRDQAEGEAEERHRPGGRGSRGKTETRREGEAEERQRLGRKEKLRKKTQTAQGNTTEPRPHTAVISFIPILLLSLRTSNCIGVNIQPPATLSNNPKT